MNASSETTTIPARKRGRRPKETTAADSLKSILADLQAAQAQVRELTEKCEKLDRAATSASASEQAARNARGVLEAELEQLHALLDALPGCLSRETQIGDSSWNTRKNAAMTRLASWLAIP